MTNKQKAKIIAEELNSVGALINDAATSYDFIEDILNAIDSGKLKVEEQCDCEERTWHCDHCG